MSGRRYYESYSYLYGGPEWAQKGAEILSKKIKLAIFTEQIGEDQLIVNAPLRDWVGAHCELVRSIGNYRVYSIRREPAVPKTVGPKQ